MQIICTVDIRTRELALEDVTIAAFDHLVDDILFDVEPIDGFELDTSTIKIAAVGPLGEQHDYEIDPSTVTVDEETGNINFIWSIPVGVTAMPLSSFKINDIKKITFAVCAEIVSGDNLVKAWHSNDGTIKVKAHLEPESGGGETPEEQATNAQKIGQLQTATAILQRKISGIASGAPPTADSTDDMNADVSTVYINTTDGNWYYWDGSAWQIGGVYGGAVTSTTFNKHGVPADDFAVGEALAEKADAGDVTALETAVADKADADDVAAVNTSLNGISLGVDPITGYLYVYVNGKKRGTGIDIGAEGIDVSSAVEWYRQPIKSALAYVDNLGQDEWVHHVVMADSHYDYVAYDSDKPNNYGHSGAICKILMSTGFFDKFIHLGDMTQFGDADDLNVAIEQVGDLNGQMLYCVGNHEIAGDNEIASSLYDAFMSDLSEGITYPASFDSTTYKNSYYVYKDTEHKIAYFHVPSWLVDSTAPGLIPWLWEKTAELPEGWTVFFIGHADWYNLSNDKKDMMFGFYSLTSLRKGCYLSGHAHTDLLTDRGSFYSVIFDNDACFTEEDRVEGTTTEQAVSILSIGTGSNNSVKIYRIGAYADSYAQTAPMIQEFEMSYNHDGEFINAAITTSGTLDTSNTATYIQKKWIPVEPSTATYVYSSEFVRQARKYNFAEYSDKRIDTFVNSSRKYVDAILLNLYALKITTHSQTNDMLVACNNADIAGDIVISQEVPIINTSINDATWVSGTVGNTGAVASSSANKVTDILIHVEPGATYVLDNSNNAVTWLAVGKWKTPCTGDNVNRETGSALPFTFTTANNINYVAIAYSGTADGDWTLTKSST